MKDESEHEAWYGNKEEVAVGAGGSSRSAGSPGVTVPTRKTMRRARKRVNCLA